MIRKTVKVRDDPEEGIGLNVVVVEYGQRGVMVTLLELIGIDVQSWLWSCPGLRAMRDALVKKVEETALPILKQGT